MRPTDPDSPSFQSDTFRAVATYSDDAREDFLRFGRFDTLQARYLIQGPANLLDCVLQAEELFGTRWMIMATP